MTQNYKSNLNTSKRICWMTDLHLDQADSKHTSVFLRKLEDSEFDIALITGDIASSSNLPEHLAMLAKACGSKPLYITLGNHDYYGSSISETLERTRLLCGQIPNLHHLSESGAIDLDNYTFLVGGDGWADGQWRGRRTEDIRSPDHYSIRDFRSLNKWQCYRKMKQLGKESTNAIRQRIKPKMRSAQKIIIANHIPPFRTSALFNGKPCDANYQPHFVQSTLGAMLIGMAKENPEKQFMTLSGHTHSECSDQVFTNLTSMVGGHKKHQPKIQEILAA